MAVPEFDETGNLPRGVYRATLAEAIGRFGSGSDARAAVARRLERIYDLVSRTGHLHRFVVFGSFVTSKDEPRDLDLVIIMSDFFRVDLLEGETSLIYRHSDADSFFGASVFWSTRAGALGGEDAMIECWQVCRGGGFRGIVEIVSEAP